MRHGWLRLWTDVTSDLKLRRVSPAQRWVWVTILVLACKSLVRGRLMLSNGVPVTLADLHAESGVDKRTCASAVKAFVEMNMLVEGEDGVLSVVHWNERQPLSDRSTPRVAAFRDRFRNGGETPPDTDTDTDIESVSKTDTLSTAPAVSARGEIGRAYERATGSTVPTGLMLLGDVHPTERVIEGIYRAAKSGNTSVPYIEGICKRLAADGWKPGARGSVAPKKERPKPVGKCPVCDGRHMLIDGDTAKPCPDCTDGFVYGGEA